MIFSFPPLDLSPLSLPHLPWPPHPLSPPPPPLIFYASVSGGGEHSLPCSFFFPSIPDVLLLFFFSSLPLFHLVPICLACWRRNHVLLPAGDHGWDGVVGVLLWIHGHLPSSHAGLLLLWRILLQALSRTGEHQQDPPRPHILSRPSHPHLHGKMRRGRCFS